MTIVNKDNIVVYFRKRFNDDITIKAGTDLVDFFSENRDLMSAVGLFGGVHFTTDQLPYRFRENKSIIEPDKDRAVNPEWIDGCYEAVIAYPRSDTSKAQAVIYKRPNYSL